jgi:hypothetical protein
MFQFSFRQHHRHRQGKEKWCYHHRHHQRQLDILNLLFQHRQQQKKKNQ